jgi:acyl-CoA thioester hydrolase
MKTFKTRLRVRYAETDQMQVAYYGSYFVWFEVARTQVFREIGLEYSRLEEEGFYLMVVGAHCEYKAPCKYDDLITICTKISEVKNSSLSFDYQVYKDTNLLACGKTTHVFCDEQGKPVRIPQKVKQMINKVCK